MPTAQNTRRLGEWQPPQCPFLVQYSPGVLSRIRQAAEDGLHSLRGGVEVGGVLFGTHEKDRVRILSFRPMECEHLYGPSFVLSEQDREGLARLLEDARRSPALQGLEPVGWYHSHTRSEIQLSATDLDTYQRFFGGGRQIALLLRPSADAPTRAGFFFRELDGGVHSASTYLEFDAPVTPKLGEARTPAPSPAAPEPSRARAAADPPFEGRMSLTRWPLSNPPGAAVPPPPPPGKPLGPVPSAYASARATPAPPPAEDPPAYAVDAQAAAAASPVPRVGEPPADEAAAAPAESPDIAGAAKDPPGEPASESFPPREPLLPGELPDAIGPDGAGPRKKKRIWPWVAAAMLAVAAGSAYLYYGRVTPVPVVPLHSSPLHLSAIESDGVLRIAWDPSALASREIRSATLVIDDGVENHSLPVSAQEAHGGSFLYPRHSDEVRIHFSVQLVPDGLMEDSATFLAPAASPVAAALPNSAPAPAVNVPPAPLTPQEPKKTNPPAPAHLLPTQATAPPVREEPKKTEPAVPPAASLPTTAHVTPAPPAVAPKPVTETHQPVYIPPPPKPALAATPKLDQPINIPSRTTVAPALPIAQTALAIPAPQPAPAPVKPAAPASLSGRWIHAATAPSGSPFPPQSASLTLTETGGTLYGFFTGQYRVPKGQKVSPQVEFTFEGAAQAASLRFPFTNPEGLKGEVEVIRLPGKANTIEVVWHSSKDNLTFDDVFSRSP